MKSRFRWLLLVLGLCSALSWAQGRPPREGRMVFDVNRSSLREDITRFNADRAQGVSGWGAPPEERGMREAPVQQDRGMGRHGGRHGPRG